MPIRAAALILAIAVCVPIATGTFAQPVQRAGLRNFGIVSDHLYRGGQPLDAGFTELKKLGIDIVVNMRDEPAEIARERALVEAQGMRYVSIPWRGKENPKTEQVAQFVKVVRENPDRKVFVHCERGAERTGLMVACYRMSSEGWTPEKALAEMEKFGFRGLRFAHLKRFVREFPALLLRDPYLKNITQDRRIDRRALVTRHNPTLRRADPLSPLSLGNGEFAFTADITGLQTFPRFYDRDAAPASARGTTPLVTQSQWGWHTYANPRGFRPEDAFERYDAHGRSVEYASAQTSAAGVWLRENPHRLNLARVGFVLRKADGSEAALDDLQETEQTLDLWTGTLSSRFTLEDAHVRVESWVHPHLDLLAVRVDPGALPVNRLAVRVAFPYVRAIHSGDPSDWTQPDRSRTSVASRGPDGIEWLRTLDASAYSVRLGWAAPARVDDGKAHEWLLSFERARRPLEFVISFSEKPGPQLPDVAETRSASARRWQVFWEQGGALDLSGSTDPRARELERRVVLSQYLTAIQGSGSRPPQETGLTYNSWFGKFHLEMHWWHAAHFALWNRVELLERSLPWYSSILASARETARRQGYKGARWPKMTAPDGRDSPSGVGVFLIWQQPHPIYLAELVYRQRLDRGTLERYRELVFDTATFMTSYAAWREGEQRYVLGPPLIPAQEIHPARTTFNPGFELAYWRFGLETAQRWRERLGLPRDADWDRVLMQLSRLPSHGGLYVNAESAPGTFSNTAERRDHPTLLASCGMLPCQTVDREMMRRTLREVMQTWNFGETWGWDYPLIAMTAARVGEPETAIAALLMDTQKNTYLASGHNYQDARLTVYLPGNGGLLTAVAMMAAGWDGAPDVPTPGFPKDGRWTVRWEGLGRLP